MKQSVDTKGNVTLTIDEYELHLFFCTVHQNISRELGILDEHYLKRVVIVPEESGEGYCTEDITKKWETHINDFFEQIRTLDCELHDDLEYTCG